MRIFLAVTLLAGGLGLARAQGDVALVNQVSGSVSFTPQVGKPGKVAPFMKVREGDRFVLPAGARLRLVYFEGSRQERWAGPATFQAGKLRSTPVAGAPAEVSTLPAAVPQRIALVPDLLRNARLGGVQVRGASTAPRVADEALRDARSTYERLRKQLPPDDITAELYLFSALSDYHLYDEMSRLAAEMLRKQPDSEDVKALAAWAEKRRGR